MDRLRYTYKHKQLFAYIRDKPSEFWDQYITKTNELRMTIMLVSLR